MYNKLKKKFVVTSDVTVSQNTAHIWSQIINECNFKLKVVTSGRHKMLAGGRYTGFPRSCYNTIAVSSRKRRRYKQEI